MRTIVVEQDSTGLWRSILMLLAHAGVTVSVAANRTELLDRVRSPQVDAIFFEEENRRAESVRVVAHPNANLVVLSTNLAVLPQNSHTLVVYGPVWADRMPQVVEFVRNFQGLPSG